MNRKYRLMPLAPKPPLITRQDVATIVARERRRSERRRTDAQEGWHTMVGLMFRRRQGKMAVQVGLTQQEDGMWVVLALEAPAGDGHNAVLENHAHKLVGTFPFATAIRKAEQYAKRWRPTLSPACPCDDIAVPKKSRGRRRRRA